MKAAKSLVIGQGSIGRRHARILRELGCPVAVVSSRAGGNENEFASVRHALNSFEPAYIVIANETSDHLATVGEIAAACFRGKVLCEKPLFEKSALMPSNNFEHVAVAYNLRLHPSILRLKEILDDVSGIAAASVYVGSYMPDWRPETDYRNSYSAHDARGGGVLRDLSHEIDYAALLFGDWNRLTAAGGHVSTLDINTEDAFTILMSTEKCELLSVHMNYLDRPPRRQIVVNAGNDCISVDLIAGTLARNGKVQSDGVARDDTYRAQHVAMLDGEVEMLCSVEEALKTVKTIEAAKQAALSRVWVAA